MTEAQFNEFRQKIAKEQFSQALQDVKAILAQNKDNADALGALAVAKFHLKDTSCIEDLNRAIELDSKNAFRYSSRAYILDALGDTKAAVEDYLKAVELDPEDYVAFNNLGLLEEKLGRKEKAKANFDKSDKLMGLEKKNGAYHFPEKPLQQQLDKAKEKTLTQTFVEIFTSKKGWQAFYQFLTRKLKKS